MQKWAIRAPSAFYHIMASVAFFFLARKFSQNKWICLASAFIFSVLPWIFPVSRTGIGGYNPMLFGMICGACFLLSSIARKSIVLAVPAAVFWAFAFYSHHGGKPLSAVFILCFLLAFNVMILKRIKPFIAFLAVLGFLLLPMALSVVNNPSSLTTRFNAISVWRDNPSTFEVFSRILQRYFEYFSPQFLFISGDPNYVHSTQSSGALYFFMAPMLALGIFRAIFGFRKNPYFRLLVLATATYPAAAMLTIGHMHSTACINGAVFFTLFSAIGAKFIIFKKKYRFAIFLIVSFLAVYEMTAYFANYFTEYRKSSRGILGATAIEAIEEACSLREKDETLYISRGLFFPEKMLPNFKPEFYPVILFLAKIHPNEYIQNGSIPESTVSLYDGHPKNRGILLRLDSLFSFDVAGNPLIAKNDEILPESSELIKEIPTPSGINIEIYRISR